jgi:hypothetical protein
MARWAGLVLMGFGVAWLVLILIHIYNRYPYSFPSHYVAILMIIVGWLAYRRK